MDYITIVNTIRDNSTDGYRQRIPKATRDNFSEVGTAILSYEADQNEFCNALVNRIAYPEVSNRRYSNPLAILKTGRKIFGDDIEEIYTNPVTAVTYNGSNTEDMLKITPPDVKTIFHKMNRRDKYPVSITTPMLRKAFTSGAEFNYFFNSILTALYSGDEIDEYLLMRNLVTDAIANNKVKTLELDYDGEEKTSKDLIKLIKTLSLQFTFPSSDYNGYGVLNAERIEAGEITACTTWTPKENQILLIRADVDASTDVEVLAKAFNMDKTDFIKRKFVIDSFGDKDTLCFICDDAIFKCKDDEYQVRSFDNGSNLTTNYWLHHWQTLSLSLFGNGVAIKQTTPTAEPEA